MSSKVVLQQPRLNPLKERAAIQKLGGQFEVTHGTIVFSKDDVAMVGDIVELDDIDASLILEQRDKEGKPTMVRRLRPEEVAERQAALKAESDKAERTKKKLNKQAA